MALVKDVARTFKALALGHSGDVTLDSNDAAGVRANGAPLSGTATVASAAAMPVPTARTILVTGTTNVTSISTGAVDGQMVTFKFAGILTFTDGSNLKTAGDFVTSADDCLTLVCISDVWYEVARSAN